MDGVAADGAGAAGFAGTFAAALGAGGACAAGSVVAVVLDSGLGSSTEGGAFGEAGAAVVAAGSGDGSASGAGPLSCFAGAGALGGAAVVVAAFTACWQAGESLARFCLRHCAASGPPRGTLQQ